MEAAKKPLRAVLIAALSLGMLVVSGCSSTGKRTHAPSGGSTATGEVGPPEPYGPMPQAASESYGPEPVALRPLVLVLGPGAARAFAHAGVLRALHDAKIPVGAIVGTEMGAMIGAIYSAFPTINAFEWQIQKLRDSHFIDRRNILGFGGGGALSDGERIDAFLKQCFSNRELRELRMPLRMTLREAYTDKVALIDQGPLAAGVRAALAMPVVFEPVSWGDKQVQSGTQARPYPVSEAKSLGIGPVVVVDVIGRGRERIPASRFAREEAIVGEQFDFAEKFAATELEAADLVIEPKLDGIAFLDFGKRSEAAFRGKAAVKASLARLRSLVGLPPQSEAQPEAAPAGASE